MIAAMPQGCLDHCAGIGGDDETPILTVGMPRSRTTLVEQICLRLCFDSHFCRRYDCSAVAIYRASGGPGNSAGIVLLDDGGGASRMR
jgi:hypothetical protein